MKIGRLKIGKPLIAVAITAFAAFILAPLLWMLTASLRAPMDAFKWPPRLFPTEFNTRNYEIVFEKVDIFKFLLNSVKIAVLGTGTQVICASMAAYAFARLRFRGSKLLFMLFLSAMMIPGTVLGIPRFIIMSKLGLIDTHFALILPAAFGVMGIFLIRQYMLTIPKAYDEAATIDGASRFFIFSRIIVPMTKPAIIVIAVQTFIGNWNDFYGPLIYINSESKMTLPLGLTALNGMLGAGNQAALLASVLMTLIAPLLFYTFGQRYLVEGINLGGVKG
ncbi:MAG: carbohydrate ABC transporter permease [Eubacteriales bacterium]|nr:carbohydrate ABC transporter permease [Eubacteriales bacterium]